MNSDLVELILIARPYGSIYFYGRERFFKYDNSRFACNELVYVLFNDDEVLYIGRTGDLGRRMRQHRKKEYTYVMVIDFHDFRLAEDMERLMIVSTITKYNRQKDFSYRYILRYIPDNIAA